MRRWVAILMSLAALAVCSGSFAPPGSGAGRSATSTGTSAPSVPLLDTVSWSYQLQGYPDGSLDEIAAAPHQLTVVDLARDAGADYFRHEEISAVQGTGKRVLAYFEIGSIENFRPEYTPLLGAAGDLVLNRWDTWPQEFFVKYWDERWWDRVVRPRLDQALSARFDGVYLDTPLAYEELDLGLVPGYDRQGLARLMADLVIRMSRYAKQHDPDFLIVPQNSPELRVQAGYTQAIDGIGIEELYFRATDEPCTEDNCTENLDNIRALRAAGKLVLAVDYAANADNVGFACDQYRAEQFAGYVAPLELNRVQPPCF